MAKIYYTIEDYSVDYTMYYSCSAMKRKIKSSKIHSQNLIFCHAATMTDTICINELLMLRLQYTRSNSEYSMYEQRQPHYLVMMFGE